MPGWRTAHPPAPRPGSPGGEGQLRRIAEANVIGILRVVEGEIVGANAAFLHMLGYTRDDLQAGRLRWRDLAPPELHPLGEQAEEDMRRTGVARPFEKEDLVRDGRRVPVLVGAARLDEEEGPGHLAFVLDLSGRASLKRAQTEREALLERQATERARHEAVLQQQPVGVLVADAGTGRVQFAHRRFEELPGREVQPGVVAETVLRHILDPEGRPLDGNSPLDEALRRGRATVDQDLRVVREGGQRSVWASAAPGRNRLGTVLAAVLTLDEAEERPERLLPALWPPRRGARAGGWGAHGRGVVVRGPGTAAAGRARGGRAVNGRGCGRGLLRHNART